MGHLGHQASWAPQDLEDRQGFPDHRGPRDKSAPKGAPECPDSPGYQAARAPSAPPDQRGPTARLDQGAQQDRTEPRGSRDFRGLREARDHRVLPGLKALKGDWVLQGPRALLVPRALRDPLDQGDHPVEREHQDFRVPWAPVGRGVRWAPQVPADRGAPQDRRGL